MYYFLVALELQSLQELDPKPPYQSETHSLKVVVPYKLVKVNA